MATDVRSMQFFLKDLRQESVVLEVLKEAIGIVVDSSNTPIDEAIGVLQMDDYSQGYRTGCLASWPATAGTQVDEHKVAHFLAKRLTISVLMEIPQSEPLWLLTSPDGSQALVPVRVLEDGIDLAQG